MRTRAMTKPAHIRRDQMRAITACGKTCHDNRRWMRPRFEHDEAAHIAESLADAREYADMDAIEHDGYALARDWDIDATWCEVAYWMPEVDARTCGCWACEARLLDIEHDEVSHAPTDTLVSLMEQPPNGAPVAPEGWNEAVYAA